MDKKIISDVMDEHTENISVAFGDWLYKYWMPCDITDKWKECLRISQYRYTTKELYHKFIEEQLQISNNNTLIP